MASANERMWCQNSKLCQHVHVCGSSEYVCEFAVQGPWQGVKECMAVGARVHGGQ